jgi:hypothetical protein
MDQLRLRQVRNLFVVLLCSSLKPIAFKQNDRCVHLTSFFCSQNKPKTSNIFLRRRSSVFGDNAQRSVDSSAETAVAAPAQAGVGPFEAVAWVRIATGGGGGCAWPGFVGVIEADGTNGIVAKGTLKIVKNASKSKAVPEELLADGAVICSCQWEGEVIDLKTANAVMFETLQDK